MRKCSVYGRKIKVSNTSEDAILPCNLLSTSGQFLTHQKKDNSNFFHKQCYIKYGTSAQERKIEGLVVDK